MYPRGTCYSYFHIGHKENLCKINNLHQSLEMRYSEVELYQVTLPFQQILCIPKRLVDEENCTMMHATYPYPIK